MGVHRRHERGEVSGKLKVERDADGKIRFTPPPNEGRDPIRPETIAQERPEQPPDPRPPIDPNIAAG